MSLKLANGSRKRKQDRDDNSKIVANGKHAISENIGLEMESGDEEEGARGAGPADSDSEAVDDFPELNEESDSEEDDEVEDEDEDENATPDEEELDEGDSDDSLHILPKAKVITSDITGQPKKVYPEIEPDYDSDSSTEEDPNRIGNVPLHWYDDLPHIGYDINGKKILRPAKGDELDKFLKTVEDPSAWTSGYDKSMQVDKPLTDEELDIIRRLHAGENPDAEYDPYEPTVEWFTGKGKEEAMPLSAAPEPKRRWVPSKWEKQKVMKIVRAIRQGRIVPNKPKTADNKSQFFNIWADAPADRPPPLTAPKVRLPTNAESYNPPEEYLPTEEERKEWEEADKEDRESDFLSQKYPSLRVVPAYDQFIQERFSRQLDLYLAPRIQRKKLDMNPEDLIPKLPSPSSLKPFPNYKALRYRHEGDAGVRCVSVSPDGAWVASGDDNGVVCLYEVLVGCEVRRWKFESKIGALAWCPRQDVCYLAVGVKDHVHFVVPPYLPPAVLNATISALSPATLPPAPATPSIKWSSISAANFDKSSSKPILSLELSQTSGLIKNITWHKRGDYVASVSDNEQGSVWIHQISRRNSQAPFKKVKGAIQCVLFHPSKPQFFVATQRYVRIYDLAAQKLVKALQPGLRWISSMDIHPSGDHLLVAGYDRKLCWFDLELSTKPYKILRYHSRAIRSVAFHPAPPSSSSPSSSHGAGPGGALPLFATSSDDGTVQVFHGRVYSDLMTDPLIVPLKILRGHEVRQGLGVLALRWVPGQPWLVSAGADGQVVVWLS